MAGLELLGSTHEWGSLMLQLLEQKGWTLVRTQAFAGEGILVVARKGPFEVRRQGATLAEFATDLFMEAMALDGATGARREAQLTLADAIAHA